MGWRSAPFITDNVVMNTAKAIGLGRPVAHAWLDAAHTDPVYIGRPTYIKRWTRVRLPFGRAAVIFPCGRDGDRVGNLQRLGRPTCLRMRYWDNN